MSTTTLQEEERCCSYLELRWEWQDTPVSDNEHHYITGGGALLVIPRASVSDSGRYSCMASNSAGSSRLDINLQVQAPLSAHVTPSILTAALGQPAAFHCSKAGSPIKSIAWAKDGQSLQSGNPSDTLKLGMVTKEDQGMYQCFVNNEHDSAQATAELRLGDTPPQITYRFIRQTIQPGPLVSLKCVASGNPTPNIKWTLDGFALPQNERFVIGQYVPSHGDVISHVNITSVKVEDGGTYKCTATNRVGEASHSAELYVYGLPQVRPMGEVSAVAGEALIISCPVAGYPIHTIKWFRGDRSLPLTRRHVVFPNGTLIVEKVQAGADGDGGAYRCTASDKLGRSASGSVHVKVMVPPKITPFSFRSDLLLGERIGVQCVVSKGDPPLTIQWLKDGVELALSETSSLLVRELDQFTSILSINDLARHHEGNYTCLASNTVARAHHTATLSVNVPPTWVVEPQNKAAKLGQVAVLDCKVEGFPQPTVVWKKVSGETLGHYRDITTGVLSNGSLVIDNVRQEEQGQYLCEASNGIGEGLSSVVTLTVNAPVHFKVRSKKELVRRGGTAVVQCLAHGDLPINLSWRKEGSFIDLGGRISVKNATSPGGLISELSIRSVRTDDSGVYTCIGRNHYGHDQSTIHLLVQDVPGKPFNVRLVDHSSRQVQLSWTPPQDGNSPITRYIIRYAPLQGESWLEGSLETSVEGKEIVGVMSNLHPATTYSVQIIAENSLGLGEPSMELRVTTEEEAPSAAPRNVKVEATSSTQLVVSWDSPPGDQWNGVLLGHYVGHREAGEVKKQGIGSQKQYNFTTVLLRSGGAKEEVRLTRLRKFCKYAIIVQAYNKRGAGPQSTEVIAQTLEDVPEAAPRQVSCEPTSPESLQVTWQPPPDALVHGIIQGYRLFYETSEDMQDVTEVQTKITTALTTKLHGLLKYTNYSIDVLAFTRVGDGARSERIFCRTKEDVPDAPANIKAMLEKPDIAVVAWLPPANRNGVIHTYGIHIHILEGGNLIDKKSMRQPAGSGSVDHLRYTMAGLKKRHVYEFSVTAFTDVGEGQSTPAVTVTPSTKVNAGILSFGTTKVVAWRSDVRFHCRVVGIPEPKQEWKNGDVKINFQQPGSRVELMGDGSLMLKSAQRSDQGEYTCSVSNEHSQDFITYLLLVQVPPDAPLLLITGSTAHTLQLQWKLGDDGGSPTKGFVIHLKAESGEWEEIRVGGSLSTYALSNLRCGTLYHVFLTAYNRVGSGKPSRTLPVRTRGSLPLIPVVSQVLIVNSTQVGIRLNAWPDGGCPMLYFVIEYALANAMDFTVVGNNISPDKLYNIVGLTPATEYRLRITSHNSAGSTTATYTFVTLNNLGVTVIPSQVVTLGDHRQPFHKDIKVVTLSIFSSIMLILSLLALCFCVKRRDLAQTPGRILEETQSTATQDNKHNRDQYYATVRKLPPSPAHLECIPEYSEDIRPYATFHVSSAGDDTKLQTFAYRESQLSPSRKSTTRVTDDYCRKKSRQRLNEDYDSYGSESDTEPGNSSRGESTNQLDERGGFHVHGGRKHSGSSVPHEPLYPEWGHAQSPSHTRAHAQYQRRYYHLQQTQALPRPRD
ncbi:cell adhesion molecule Dscam2-like [Macrosteles quadrilineatus]|uniref:cell adhesion molecule Dscam2-like n=1 Tax=Macrosteles quadrilineatus TaxID=74068 RepID=UPI0023E09796|nr:cell adhesion molecule Dscam2-like [Macrosteles quadrilineatus]